MYKKRGERRRNRAQKKNQEARRNRIQQYNTQKRARVLKCVASESGDK